MQAVQDQKPCSNCSKPFPQNRIDLHEAYCFRNFRKCPLCPAFVDLHDLDSHQEEFHLKKPCNHCKHEFLPHQLNAHSTQCPRRPRSCQYCETDFASAELNSHEGVCGARTRVCQTCRQPVMLKDLVTHQPRCKQLPPPPVASRPVIPINMPDRNPDRRNRPILDRQRDVSGNNARHLQNIGGGGQRSLSTNKPTSHNNASRKSKQGKYNCVIPAENPRPMVQILPISIQLTINSSKRQNRQPFRMRNVQV